MEKKQIEFEGYIEALMNALKVDNEYRHAICNEIRQNLYDKQNELLIRGYTLETSADHVLKCFEEPKELAAMFNRSDTGGHSFIRFVNREKVLLAGLIAVLLMALAI